MPFLQTVNPTYGRPLSAALGGALSVVPGAALLTTPHVHLFTAGPAPITPANLPADFTEATFVGYAPTVLALPLLGPLQFDTDDLGWYNDADFLAGAVVPPGQSILGYWVDEAAAGGLKLYMGEIFAAPVPIANIGDFINLDLLFAIREIFAGLG